MDTSAQWESVSGWANWGVALTLIMGSWTSQPTVAEDEQPAQDIWRIGQPVSLEVRNGRSVVDLPTTEPGASVLVIVSTLAPEPGPFQLRMSTRLIAETERRPPSQMQELDATLGTGDDRKEAAHSRREPELPRPLSTALWPEPRRVFSLLTKDGHVASASNYEAVSARLCAVGRRVQIYLDENDLDALKEETLREIVTTFDEEILPAAARVFGGVAEDVDSDGRFTILLSRRLARLAGGTLCVDGFVRGADFDPRIPQPFGNHCDMLYLNAALESGPYLKTILAHEYAHAVTLSRRRTAMEAGTIVEEEGWLDEAMAHLFEDLCGFSLANLDYRVDAFLSAPERYQLVVRDYYHEGLFRGHGNRGSTYLFLRWCFDQYGSDLLRRLASSQRVGIENLEAATGASFPRLFQNWSVDLARNGLGITEATEQSNVRSTHPPAPRQHPQPWPHSGPRMVRMTPGDRPVHWNAVGTSSRFMIVEGHSRTAVRLAVEGPPEADLQVTVIPLPTGLPRIDLTLRAVPNPDGGPAVQGRVTERSGLDIQFQWLSWEPLVPEGDRRSATFRRQVLDAEDLTALLGTARLSARTDLELPRISLEGIDPSVGPFVFKLLGVDQNGRPVAAWAEVDLKD